MRTIIFRGCEWNADNELLPFVYGKLCDVDVIRTIKGVDKVVHYKTVGQFTGLQDKNGKDIYEGDVIKSTTDFYNVKKERTTIIEWNNDIENDSFGCPITAGYSILGYDWEIIGNIHENPELLN